MKKVIRKALRYAQHTETMDIVPVLNTEIMATMPVHNTGITDTMPVHNTETMVITPVRTGEKIAAIGGPAIGYVKYFHGFAMHGFGYQM